MCIRVAWSESSLKALSIGKDTQLLCADNEDWSDFADTQADLSLRWRHMSEGTVSHVVA